MSEHDSQAEPAASQHLTRFLQKLKHQTLGRAGEATVTEPAPESSSSKGTTEDAPGHIGRYETLGEIARGGMGIIFKVQDAEMRRTLAMKVLQGEIFQQDGTLAAEGSVRTSRFLEEAQVTGQLEHPGIIPVHEMGLDESGRLFFTMRLVKGKTLGEVIKLHNEGDAYWTRTRALGAMMKVCEAMAFAHEKHVIHRDLKPANVMVGRFGETYVMDWGLAKILGTEEPRSAKPKQEDVHASMLSLLSSARTGGTTPNDADSTHSTMEGDVLGTPAYMPPEQARGQLDEMGPASDIYSVGAMLYHLLSGSAPFTTGGSKSGPLQILQGLMEGPPAPLEKVATGVPPELVAICERAMAREPEQRYPTMMALADDLHAFMEQRVVQAYETGSWAEFRKWVARNKGMALSAAAAIVFAISGLAAIGYMQARGKAELASKNDELKSTNEKLASTNAALDEASARALANEKRALEQEAEAKAQSYRANVSAAAVLLDSGSSGEAGNRLSICDADQRGWEWSFLDKLTNSSLRKLDAHEEFATDVSFSPSGRLLLTVGGGPLRKDHSVKMWEVESGETRLRILPHSGGIYGAEFTPGGTEFVTSGVDGQTILWDAETGEELLRTPTSGAFTCHPDGRRIVIGASQGPQFTVWDIYEEQTRSFSMNARGGVNAIRIVGDEDLAVVGTSSFDVALVDLVSGETLRVFDILRGRPLPPPKPELGNGVIGLDVDDRRGLLLSGSSDGSLILWNLETGEIEQLFEGHRGGVRSAFFHPQGPWIVSCDVKSPVRFWHENGKTLEELHGHENWSLGIALRPDGDRIASCSLDGTVLLWDGHPGSNVRTFFGDGDQSIRFLDFSPDGNRLVWTTSTERVLVGNTRTGEAELALPLFDQRIQGLAFGPAGKRVFVTGGDGRTTVWDAETGELQRASRAFGRTSAVAYSPDRGRIALSEAAVAPEVTLIDSATMDVITSWRMPDETRATNQRVQVVTQLDFTPEGERLFANTGLENISILDAQTGELLSHFDHPDGFGYVRYDDKRDEIIALGSYAGTSMRFHDASTGEVKREYGGHAILTCLTGYSPDGTRIAVGASDGSISLWDPDFGELTTLSGIGSTGTGQGELNDVIGGAVFSPDGSAIATLDWNGTCRVWDRSALQSQQSQRRAANRRRAQAVDATELVDRLFEKHILVADVVEALANADLDPALLEAATLAARMRGDDTDRLNRAAREVVMDDSRRPLDYVRALSAAQAASKIREWQAYRVTLGAAQYRMGDDTGAERTLEDTVQVELRPLDATLRDLFRALIAFSNEEPLKARRLFREAEAQIRTFATQSPANENLPAYQSFTEAVRERIGA